RAGARSSSKVETTESSSAPTLYEDEGEIGQLKRKYAADVPKLKELFPDWTDEDLVFALEDSNGDLESAIEHITEGNVSQWGEVKKKNTDRSRSKAKEVSKAQGSAAETAPSSTRGGRGRGGLEGRGRARGDRGRGGRGGRAGAQVNGTRAEKPTTTSTTADAAEGSATTNNADAVTTKKPTDTGESTDATDGVKETAKEAPKLPETTKKGWASLFAKPTPPPPQKKPPPPAAPAAENPSEPATEPKPAEPVPTAAAETSEEKAPEQPAAPSTEPTTTSTETIEPPKDDLTKTNLEQVPDHRGERPGPSHSHPRNPQTRPTRQSSYAATAYKATAGSGRGASFQRRVLEQEEAVVMPANHAVDRAAVQFGSMGLNGDEEVDIDKDREEAETRAQPPQHSPVAPRASLPPSTQTQSSADTPSVARPAPGLPPVPQASSADAPFNDFSRYGDAQKPYDPFSHQTSQPQPQVQEPFSNQAPAQATATTGSEYSPFYAADQQRLPYNYYGGYAQSQDATAAQRAAAGFGVSGAEVQPHVPSTQPPSRYGHAEAPNSGHNTPNPTLPGATQTPSAQHIPGTQAAHGGYGYGYPYYSNPHYASYMSQMNQHQYGRNRPMYDDARRYDDHYMPHSTQYGYGTQYGPYGKGGMYGQPFSYDHSSSPANAGAFNQGLPGRDSVYGRTGSAQPENQQAAANNAFGSGMPDVFGRSQSGFGQNQQISQQQPVSSEETTKGFEASKTGGPSPSLAQANRPGSATNSAPGQPQSQTGLPPLQGQQGQQAFGGYPHLNPQYGGLGGLGGHQAAATQSHHQGTGYGNYGGAGFGNYYGNTGRGGWGGNYGH
ncbi:RNAPII degradation factor Def1, partial [Rasamsonia emersonii CBS 393.64]